MHLRETVWKRGLVAVLAVLAGCASGPDRVAPVEFDPEWGADRLWTALDEIADRADYEASIARGRIYDRLRKLGEEDAAGLMASGDASDLDLIAQATYPEYRTESLGRLARHFEERADDAALRRCAFEGPLAEPLQRFLLLSIASAYAEFGADETRSALFTKLAAAARAMASEEGLAPDAAPYWSEMAEGYDRRATASEARKFCDISLGRHLEEAVRTADLATREKVARGDERRILAWYLESLEHFVLARECLPEPTPAQEGALAAQDMVFRGLYEIIARKKE